MFKNIFLIINPASGKPEPVLHTINSTFSKTDIRWEIGVTNQYNLDKLLKQADEFNADLLAVYGGDGTVSAIAQKCLEMPKPMAILPGGTANILSVELGIPQNLQEACELIVQSNPELKTIDAARINDKLFFTRVGWGLEAKMVENASRDMKKSMGNVAYAISALQALFRSEKLKFKIKIDGKEIKRSGFACIVANSGNIGIANVSLFPVVVDDGLLDVFLFREGNIESLISTAANIINHADIKGIDHWQGKNIEISCSPRATVQCDGEILGKEDVNIRLVESAAKFVVPPQE